MSKSDPYIKASILGQNYTTAIILNTVDPEWNEKWSVQCVPAGTKLELEVFDKDVVTKDDFLGHAEYVFEDDEPLDKKKTVSVPVKEEGKEQGSITLELAFKIHGKK